MTGLRHAPAMPLPRVRWAHVAGWAIVGACVVGALVALCWGLR